MKRVLPALFLGVAFLIGAGPGNGDAHAGQPDQIMAECSRKAKADGVPLEGMRDYLRECIRAGNGRATTAEGPSLAPLPATLHPGGDGTIRR